VDINTVIFASGGNSLEIVSSADFFSDSNSAKNGTNTGQRIQIKISA